MINRFMHAFAQVAKTSRLRKWNFISGYLCQLEQTKFNRFESLHFRCLFFRVGGGIHKIQNLCKVRTKKKHWEKQAQKKRKKKYLRTLRLILSKCILNPKKPFALESGMIEDSVNYGSAACNFRCRVSWFQFLFFMLKKLRFFINSSLFSTSFI